MALPFIDVLLLFGLLGVYAHQHVESGVWGFAGLLLVAVGLETIGGPDGKIGDVDVYTTGTMLMGIGLVALRSDAGGVGRCRDM